MRTFPSAACSFLVVLPLVLIGAKGASAEIAPQIRNDKRVQKAVTVQRARVYLGELLPILSKQGNIRLSVSANRGPVDGIELTVYVNRTPLKEVMDGLQEVLSNRFNQWEWQTEKEGRGFVLVNQRAPEAATQAAQSELRARFLRDVQTVYETVRLPEPDRSTKAKVHPHLYATGELQSGRAQLLGLLTGPQLESLMKGGEALLDSSRLTGGQTEALNLGLSTGGELDGEPAKQKPAAFYVTWDSSHIGPVLMLRNGRGAATHVVGGAVWDRAALNDYSPGWISETDTEPQEHLAKAVAGDPRAGSPAPDKTVPALLKRAAEKQGLNVISDLVFRRGQGSTWLGAIPSQTIHALVIRATLTAKQQGSLWLLRDPTALVHPRRHLVSWSVIKTLRESAERRGGLLGLDDLLRLSEATTEQLKGLSEEFPNATPGDLLPWRPVLRFYSNLSPAMKEQVRDPEGMAFLDTGLVARAELLDPRADDRIRGGDLLQAHAKLARVSFRVQELGKVPEAGDLLGGRAVIWAIRIPGFPERRRTLRLHARMPLEPVEVPSPE